jgi:hypothetical protein
LSNQAHVLFSFIVDYFHNEFFVFKLFLCSQGLIRYNTAIFSI